MRRLRPRTIRAPFQARSQVPLVLARHLDQSPREGRNLKCPPNQGALHLKIGAQRAKNVRSEGVAPAAHEAWRRGSKLSPGAQPCFGGGFQIVIPQGHPPGTSVRGPPRSGVFPGMRNSLFRDLHHEIRIRSSNAALFCKFPIVFFTDLPRLELMSLRIRRLRGSSRSFWHR